LLVLAKMPEPAKQHETESSKPAGLTGRSWLYIAIYFFYNVVMFCFITDIAFVITSSKVGNAGTAGIIVTFSSAGGIAAGIILGWVTKIFRHYAIVFALGFLAVGSIMLVFVHTAPMFMLANALWGLGFGTFNSLIILQVMGSVEKSAAALAVAILTSAMGIGQFLSPMYYSLINGLLGLEGPRSSWIVAATCFVIALLISPILIAVRLRRRELSLAG